MENVRNVSRRVIAIRWLVTFATACPTPGEFKLADELSGQCLAVDLDDRRPVLGADAGEVGHCGTQGRAALPASMKLGNDLLVF